MSTKRYALDLLVFMVVCAFALYGIAQLVTL